MVLVSKERHYRCKNLINSQRLIPPTIAEFFLVADLYLVLCFGSSSGHQKGRYRTVMQSWQLGVSCVSGIGIASNSTSLNIFNVAKAVSGWGYKLHTKLSTVFLHQ